MRLLANLVDSLRNLFTTSPKRQQELEEAKRLFYSYDCNSFFMMKEGESEKYDRYRVGLIQENKWRDEYIAYWSEKMSKDGFNMEALWHIRNAGGTKSVPFLVSMAKKEDSYAKYWIANTIWSLSKDILFGSRQGRSAAIELYDELVQSKIIISAKHLREIDQGMMKMLGVETPERYILYCVQQDLAEIRK